MAVEFKLPELGENVESASVAKVLISVGDEVADDQPVLEIETDKAAAEVPSDVSGKVTEILVSEGDTVKVGQTVFRAEASEGSGQKASAAQQAEPEPEPEPQPEPEPEPEQDEEAAPRETAPAAPARQPSQTRGGGTVAAAPSVRRLARELGVDIQDVPLSEPGGRVSADDVRRYAEAVKDEPSETQAESPPRRPVSTPPVAQPGAGELPDFSNWGQVERQSMSKVRQLTAAHMARCWAEVPHVTQFDKAEVTQLEKLRDRHGPVVEKAGGKLTVTAILVKILGLALKRFPQFNASIDVANNEIIYKRYVNVGVAVDTDRGLLVPVIRGVDRKSITDIAVEMSDLAKRARERKIKPEEMQGGTFTLSNLGGIGGTAFTPIVNLPEVAILGVSRARVEPVYTDGQFEARMLLPLSLSYDHRLIDGADGARFLRWLVEAIEQPLVLLLDS